MLSLSSQGRGSLARKLLYAFGQATAGQHTLPLQLTMG